VESNDEKKKPGNRTRVTGALDEGRIRTLHTIPVVTECFELMKAKQKDQPHIYLAANQPDHGFICVCGWLFYGKFFVAHLKDCQIAKDLKAGIDPTGGSNEVGPQKRGFVNLSEYQDLEKPKFVKTGDGKLLVRYHDRHGWACAGCGKRSINWTTLKTTHVDKKVYLTKDKKEWKWKCTNRITWTSLKPTYDWTLDKCEIVDAEIVLCNKEKKEVIKNKSPKTKETPEKAVTTSNDADGDESAVVVSASNESPTSGMTTRTRVSAVVVPASNETPTSGMTTRRKSGSEPRSETISCRYPRRNKRCRN